MIPGVIQIIIKVNPGPCDTWGNTDPVIPQWGNTDPVIPGGNANNLGPCDTWGNTIIKANTGPCDTWDNACTPLINNAAPVSYT